MTPNLPAVIEQPIAPAVQQADTDQQFVGTWLGRHESPHTRGNYARQARRFLAFVDKPLREVRVRDLQAFLATLAAQAPATRANTTAALKSMFSSGHDLGYLPLNVGKAVKAPPVKNTLAERIMAEADTMRMIALEPVARNRALLTLTYGAGLRASEVSTLHWRDLVAREGGAGQATVYGKGGKTRIILLSANTWKTVAGIRPAACGPDDPVFRSRRGGAIVRMQIHRISQGRGCAGRTVGRRLDPLAAACPCLAQPRPRGADPSRAGDTRACVGRHDRALHARAAVRQFGAVSGGLEDICPSATIVSPSSVEATNSPRASTSLHPMRLRPPPALPDLLV